jgi:hypothetical protein
MCSVCSYCSFYLIYLSSCFLFSPLILARIFDFLGRGLCWGLPWGWISLSYYRNRVLCRVSKTLGKGYFTLGKAFAECNTRQRTLDKYFIGKGFIAEYFFSNTRQRLCRVSKSTRQRKTLGKLRIEFKKKQQFFLKNSRNNFSNPPLLPYPLPYHFH